MLPFKLPVGLAQDALRHGDTLQDPKGQSGHAKRIDPQDRIVDRKSDVPERRSSRYDWAIVGADGVHSRVVRALRLPVAYQGEMDYRQLFRYVMSPRGGGYLLRPQPRRRR